MLNTLWFIIQLLVLYPLFLWIVQHLRKRSFGDAGTGAIIAFFFVGLLSPEMLGDSSILPNWHNNLENFTTLFTITLLFSEIIFLREGNYKYSSFFLMPWLLWVFWYQLRPGMPGIWKTVLILTIVGLLLAKLYDLVLNYISKDRVFKQITININRVHQLIYRAICLYVKPNKVSYTIMEFNCRNGLKAKKLHSAYHAQFEAFVTNVLDSGPIIENRKLNKIDSDFIYFDVVLTLFLIGAFEVFYAKSPKEEFDSYIYELIEALSRIYSSWPYQKLRANIGPIIYHLYLDRLSEESALSNFSQDKEWASKWWSWCDYNQDTNRQEAIQHIIAGKGLEAFMFQESAVIMNYYNGKKLAQMFKGGQAVQEEFYKLFVSWESNESCRTNNGYPIRDSQYEGWIRWS